MRKKHNARSRVKEQTIFDFYMNGNLVDNRTELFMSELSQRREEAKRISTVDFVQEMRKKKLVDDGAGGLFGGLADIALLDHLYLRFAIMAQAIPPCLLLLKCRVKVIGHLLRSLLSLMSCGPYGRSYACP